MAEEERHAIFKSDKERKLFEAMLSVATHQTSVTQVDIPKAESVGSKTEKQEPKLEAPSSERQVRTGWVASSPSARVENRRPKDSRIMTRQGAEELSPKFDIPGGSRLKKSNSENILDKNVIEKPKKQEQPEQTRKQPSEEQIVQSKSPCLDQTTSPKKSGEKINPPPLHLDEEIIYPPTPPLQSTPRAEHSPHRETQPGSSPRPSSPKSSRSHSPGVEFDMSELPKSGLKAASFSGVENKAEKRSAIQREVEKWSSGPEIEKRLEKKGSSGGLKRTGMLPTKKKIGSTISNQTATKEAGGGGFRGGSDMKKQKAIEDEILKWAGPSLPKSPSQDDPKQAAIAKQVALWANVDNSTKKTTDDTKWLKSNEKTQSRESHTVTFRNRKVGMGSYEVAVWKTNAKIRSVRSRVVVKSNDGEIMLSRTLALGKQDLVAKADFVVSSGEEPVTVEVTLSFPRLLETCPVSVTLQQQQLSGTMDVPMTLESHKTRALIQPQKMLTVSEEVKIWRSLSVTVVGGRDLPSYLSNAFVTVHVANHYDRTTTLWNCKGNPIWKSNFDFRLLSTSDKLVVIATLWESGEKGRDLAVGQVRIPFWTLLSQELLSDWFELETVEVDPVGGKMHVQIIYEEGALLVRLLQATHLLDREVETTPNITAVVQIDKIVRRSRPVKGSWSPMFDEEFVFQTYLDPDDDSALSEAVLITIWHDNDTFLGQLRIPLHEIRPGRVWDQTSSLVSRFESKSVRSGRKGKHGHLKLDLQFTQTTILGLDFYQPLLQLLTEDDGSYLLLLSKIIPSSEREKLSKILAKIFCRTGTATREISRLASQEIANTDNAKVLFRGNTLTTKLIDAYQKLVAQDYLKGVLLPIIQRIYGFKRALELDPTKVDKPENLPKNKAIFDKEADLTIQCILSSVARCPPEMRSLYHLLDQKICEKFQPKDTDITRYAVVNSFLFLRLFVPAFLSPTSFQLMSDFPPEHTSRTLTLIGKTIQNLANFTHFGEKESYMTVYNDMINANIQTLKSFYMQIQTPAEDWEELPRHDNELWLEKELSLLHEWMRALHFELRSRSDVSEELYAKVMHACHVVLPSTSKDQLETRSSSSVTDVEIEYDEVGASPTRSPPMKDQLTSSDNSLNSSPVSLHSPRSPRSPHSSASPPTPSSPTGSSGPDPGKVRAVCEEAQITVADFFMSLNSMNKAAETWKFEEAAQLQKDMLVSVEIMENLEDRARQLLLQGPSECLTETIQALEKAISVFKSLEPPRNYQKAKEAKEES